jgi:hypothetical protein
MVLRIVVAAGSWTYLVHRSRGVIDCSQKGESR